MTVQLIESKANSLQEARESLRSQIPKGFRLLSEEVIEEGLLKSISGTAGTVEAAFADAQRLLPPDADVVEKRVLKECKQRAMTVDALDKESAKTRAKAQIGDSEQIIAVDLVTKGRQGFFGIGQTPNRYQCQVMQLAVVKIHYKSKAKLSARISNAKEIARYQNIEYVAAQCSECRKEGRLAVLRGHGVMIGGYELFDPAYNLMTYCPSCSRAVHTINCAKLLSAGTRKFFLCPNCGQPLGPISDTDIERLVR